MANFTGSPASISLTSNWTVTMGGGGYLYMSVSPSTASATVTFNFSSIPAGATITSANLYATAGSAPAASIKDVNWGSGSGVFSNGMAIGGVVVGGSLSVTFRYKAAGDTNTAGSRSGTLNYSGIYLAVNYSTAYVAPPTAYEPTQPGAAPVPVAPGTPGAVTAPGGYTPAPGTGKIAPSVSNFTLNGGTSDVYMGINDGDGWNAVGSYTPAGDFLCAVLQFSDGGTWWAHYSYANWPPVNIARPTTAGTYRIYRVYLVGHDMNPSAFAYSPRIYSYKALSAPTSISIEPSAAPGANVTLEWSGAVAGVGVSIASYTIYQNGSVWQTGRTGSSYTFAAPSAGTYQYKVVAVGSVSGYNSAQSSAATLKTYSAPTVSAVKIASSTSTQYASAGASVALSWSAANGTNNTIASYTITRSDNGGAYQTIKTGQTATSYTVTANPAAGEYYRYRVVAVGENSNSSAATSPLLYTRSIVGAPGTCTISPASCYPGDSVTLSWGVGSEGTGTTVAGYEVYFGSTKLTTVTTRTYTHSAPAAGSYSYTVKAVSSPTGYNSGASPAATLTVANPKSTGSLNKSTVPMDGASTIALTVTPFDAAYTHKAVWYIGASTWTDTLAVGDTSSTLTVPLAWCIRVPNATSGTASVRLESYDGASLVGSNTYTFTATVPASVVPTVSLSAAPVTGFNGLYIQGKSKAKLTPTAAGAQGSTISTYAFTGGGYSGSTSPWTTGILNIAGTNAMKVTVTDSRGRQATATANITVQAYWVPVIGAALAFRSDASGNVMQDGTRITATASLTVAPVTGNSGTAKVRMRLAGAAWSSQTQDTIAHGVAKVLTDTAAAESAYDIEITLTDTIGNVSKWTMTVPMVAVMYDFRMDRAGIGRLATDAKTLILPDDWTTNINADKLDGLDSTAFAEASHGHTGTTSATGWTTHTTAYGNIRLGPASAAYNHIYGSLDVPFYLNKDLLVAAGKQVLHAGNFLDYVYPVGAVYISAVSTSPATLFGGTWAAIAAGTFLTAAGTGYAVGTTGGAATHTHTTPNHAHTTPAVALTVAQLPAHTHRAKMPGTATAGGAQAGFDEWRTSAAFNSNPMIENTGSGSTHAHGNTGNAAPTTKSASSLPPWKAHYMWVRTA